MCIREGIGTETVGAGAEFETEPTITAVFL